jgi:transposase
MVINIEGFIKYSAIHEGNFADTSDINPLLEKLPSNLTAAKPIVVMDAGIATEKNLKALTQKGYKYLVVSRTKLKDYQLLQEGKETYLLTKSKKVIRLAQLQSEKHTDRFFKVESQAKGLKEQGIKNRLEQGYEQQLHLIQKSLTKPRGIKRLDKVQQRIGRAKQKYPSIHHLYNIHLDIDINTQTVKDLYWQKDIQKAEEAKNKMGVYFLRTNLEQTDEALGWMIYNTIRYQLKRSGIHDDWKEIKRKASTQKSVLTTAQNSYDTIIQIKRCTEPSEDLMKIHHALKGLKPKPFKQIKFVVHKPPPKKNETPAIAQLLSG